jgi:hypothetical protein
LTSSFNSIIHLQAKASSANPSNPNGCWDWWGYNSPLDYDNKKGAQMAAIMAMAQRVASNAMRNR